MNRSSSLPKIWRMLMATSRIKMILRSEIGSGAKITTKREEEKKIILFRVIMRAKKRKRRLHRPL